jgi:hypothetical protein
VELIPASFPPSARKPVNSNIFGTEFSDIIVTLNVLAGMIR